MAVAPLAETVATLLEVLQYRLSVKQYQQMIEAGILTEDDLVELLEGHLVAKMTKNLPHIFPNTRVGKLLAQILPLGWFVNTQNPISTADSAPEPDAYIARGDETNYLERLPQGTDLALVVEVSDSTLQRDRTIKLRIYARARIPVYWILNLPDSILEVYSEPTGEGQTATYQQRRVYHPGDAVPVVVDGQEVGQLRVGDLFA